MQIFVNGPGQTRVVEMEGAKSGRDLRGKVEEEFGVTRDFQILSYRGKQVGEDADLEDILSEGCTVHLAMPMFGGFSSGVDDGAWLDLYSFDDMVGYVPERPSGLHERRPPTEPPSQTSDMFVDVPALPDDDLADFDMDDASAEFLNETVRGCEVSPQDKNEDVSTPDSSVGTPDTVRIDSPMCGTESPPIFSDLKNSKSIEQPLNPNGDFGGVKFEPSASVFTFTGGEDENNADHMEHKAKRTKGVAYDLDSVDDKMRRRLIKNRQSAERSRQKKNALMKELEEELHRERMQHLSLKRETDKLRTSHVALEDENASLRALLEAHGLSLDAPVA